MISTAMPPFLLPRGNFLLVRNPRLSKYAASHTSLQWRNAATGSSSAKPRVLEKPAKFYPPSHPQRLAKRTMPRQYPGPPISQAQEEEQKFKKYPNMMPAKGTFMFWFLNSKLLHMGICLVRTSLTAPYTSSLILLPVRAHFTRRLHVRGGLRPNDTIP